jgi:hypothetical protein
VQVSSISTSCSSRAQCGCILQVEADVTTLPACDG